MQNIILNIPEKLIQLRIELGLSQAQMAKKLNVSQSKIARIEAGHSKNISPELIQKINTIFNLNTDWLFKNNELNKTTNLLNNNNSSLDNIKNNVCSDINSLEGKILMSVDDKLASVCHRLGL